MDELKYFYDSEEAFFCKRLTPTDEMGEEMTENDVVDELNKLHADLTSLRQNLKEVDEYLSSEIDDLSKSQNWREAMEEVYWKLRAHHLIEK